MGRAKCKVPGCDNQSHYVDGKCKKHHAKSLPAVDVVPVAAEGVSASFVSSSEITSSDYVAYLRQLLDEKVEIWVRELNAARTPRERAQYYLNMCNAVEGLGY